MFVSILQYNVIDLAQILIFIESQLHCRWISKPLLIEEINGLYENGLNDNEMMEIVGSDAVPQTTKGIEDVNDDISPETTKIGEEHSNEVYEDEGEKRKISTIG